MMAPEIRVESHHENEHAALYPGNNAFSKKLENLKAAVALQFLHYNFVRVHSILKVTPGTGAGITDWPLNIDDLARLDSQI